MNVARPDFVVDAVHNVALATLWVDPLSDAGISASVQRAVAGRIEG